LKIVVTPAARASRSAARFAAIGTSIWQSSTCASVMAVCAASTSAGVTSPLAPAITMMVFWPVSSIVITATPDETPLLSKTKSVRMPSPARLRRMSCPKMSSPTRPTMLTTPPNRAVITAWLAPLPP
jgi:hypothetical protein